MNEILALIFLFIGAAFLLIAAVGALRMPDLFMRIQASAKASTLGTGCVFLGVAIHFAEIGISTRALLTIVFLLLTAPVAAHMIGRAAYFVGVPLWTQTIRDDLASQYDWENRVLHAPDELGRADGGSDPAVPRAD